MGHGEGRSAATSRPGWAGFRCKRPCRSDATKRHQRRDRGTSDTPMMYKGFIIILVVVIVVVIICRWLQRLQMAIVLIVLFYYFFMTCQWCSIVGSLIVLGPLQFGDVEGEISLRHTICWNKSVQIWYAWSLTWKHIWYPSVPNLQKRHDNNPYRFSLVVYAIYLMFACNPAPRSIFCRRRCLCQAHLTGEMI